MLFIIVDHFFEVIVNEQVSQTCKSDRCSINLPLEPQMIPKESNVHQEGKDSTQNQHTVNPKGKPSGYRVTLKRFLVFHAQVSFVASPFPERVPGKQDPGRDKAPWEPRLERLQPNDQPSGSALPNLVATAATFLWVEIARRLEELLAEVPIVASLLPTQVFAHLLQTETFYLNPALSSQILHFAFSGRGGNALIVGRGLRYLRWRD